MAEQDSDIVEIDRNSREAKVFLDDFIEDEATRKPNIAEIRVGSNSDPKTLSNRIVAKIREHGYAKIRAIGPAAIGLAFMGFTISSGQLRMNDIRVFVEGAFFKVRLESGEIRKGMWLNIEPFDPEEMNRWKKQ